MITHPRVRLKSPAKTMKLLLTKKITKRLQGVKRSSTRNTKKNQKHLADPRLSNRVRALSTIQHLSLIYHWRKSCKRSANNLACSFLTGSRPYIGWHLKRPSGSSRPRHQISSLRSMNSRLSSQLNRRQLPPSKLPSFKNLIETSKKTARVIKRSKWAAKMSKRTGPRN